MATDDAQEILLEILRVGLISIRIHANLSQQHPECHARLVEWAQLCHGMPVILKEPSIRSIRYFAEVHLKSFCEVYPAKDQADYLQILGLSNELNEFLALPPQW